MSPSTTTVFDVFDAIAHRRRRHTLRLLGENDRLSDRALSSAIAAIEARREESHADADTVAVSLHHTHLPKLVDAGLIEYDEAANAVVASAALRPGDRSPGVGIDAAGTDDSRIEGRDAILSRQRAVVNRADDELFLVVNSRDALGDDTLATLRAAVERGASVYFGSPDGTLRAVVRERVPGAVVWEPRGWSRGSDEREASLVCLASADREDAMLATRERGEEHAAATAIAAADSDDPLVVLISELVDERVGRLDESRTQLPQ